MKNLTSNTFGICSECADARAKAYQAANVGRVYKVGDSVKLAFTDLILPTEHMWVKVTKVLTNNNYEGTLDNDPKNLILVKCGDYFEFNGNEVEGML